jgi:DMSO reductase family type II enzyme heme b subunit
MSVEVVPIEVRRLEAGLDELLAPDAAAWEGAAEAVVSIDPTPLDRLPSAYVQVSWRDRPRGAIGEVRVRAAAGAGGLALRLEWAALRPSPRITDVNVYPDACALLFPADGREADFGTMGSRKRPVQGWHWRAGAEAPFVVTATGIGSVERAAEHPVRARARWADGRWQVVLTGPLGAGGIPLKAGSALPVAFAVWSGAARERAGLKSYSPQPCELRLGRTGG